MRVLGATEGTDPGGEGREGGVGGGEGAVTVLASKQPRLNKPLFFFFFFFFGPPRGVVSIRSNYLATGRPSSNISCLLRNVDTKRQYHRTTDMDCGRMEIFPYLRHAPSFLSV